jgi:hypothetical protein
VIILSPPEKLVLEISTTGRYHNILWFRNGRNRRGASYAHFDEVYFVEHTTAEDFGIYQIDLDLAPSQQARAGVQFYVVSSGTCSL